MRRPNRYIPSGAHQMIRNGAVFLVGPSHADIRTTEVYFIRKEEDAEVAARRIHIRLTGRKGE